jgi:hypothetical protein
MSDSTTDIIVPILRKIQEDLASFKTELRSGFGELKASISNLERGQDMLAKEIVAVREDIKELRQEILDYKDHERRLKRIEGQLGIHD